MLGLGLGLGDGLGGGGGVANAPLKRVVVPCFSIIGVPTITVGRFGERVESVKKYPKPFMPILNCPTVAVLTTTSSIVFAGTLRFCTNTLKARAVEVEFERYSDLPDGVAPLTGSPVKDATRNIPVSGVSCARESCVKYNGKKAHIIAPTKTGRINPNLRLFDRNEIKLIFVSF
jgi:hypothetical protein